MIMGRVNPDANGLSCNAGTAPDAGEQFNPPLLLVLLAVELLDVLPAALEDVETLLLDDVEALLLDDDALLLVPLDDELDATEELDVPAALLLLEEDALLEEMAPLEAPLLDDDALELADEAPLLDDELLPLLLLLSPPRLLLDELGAPPDDDVLLVVPPGVNGHAARDNARATRGTTLRDEGRRFFMVFSSWQETEPA
ncbi:MAG: hypothetical protein AB2A00_15465 [Myxococcota bacterium]